MYEQDYIMRLIKEMVRAVLKLLFHIDTETPTSAVALTRQRMNCMICLKTRQWRIC